MTDDRVLHHVPWLIGSLHDRPVTVPADWQTQAMTENPPPLWDPLAVPAATVIVLRDTADGPEVLMLKRDRGLSFAGGMWVFPGGRIDDADHDAGHDAGHDGDDLARIEAAARRAAVREAAEEAGIAIDADALRRWAHWTPPPLQEKRFSTAFFVAPAVDADTDVIIDDGEIRAHRWARPAEAIEMRDVGEIALTPPTFITLVQLLDFESVAGILASRRPGPVEHFSTRVAIRDEGWTAVYHGDVTYEAIGDAGGKGDVDLDAPGPRHRLSMAERWVYLREGC